MATTQKNGKSKIYQSWDDMTQRCTNPNFRQYKDYGGSGISICERWRKFVNFLEDMGEKPKGLTLEKTNNKKGYCKENCRWATRKEQQRNRRNNRIETYNGKTQCLTDWAKEFNTSKETLRNRVVNLGWSIKRALVTPIRNTKPVGFSREKTNKNSYGN